MLTSTFIYIRLNSVSDFIIILIILIYLIYGQARGEKRDALWKPSFLSHFIISKEPKYTHIIRVCPEISHIFNDSEMRMLVFYRRMLRNHVSQGLITEEESKARHLIQCRRLADMPRKLPEIIPGLTEFEQACLLLDGE